MYTRSILRGYDKVTEKVIADALHIPLDKRKKQKKHHKGVHNMKIPMSALKKDVSKKKGKGNGKAKLSSLKKKQANDGDGDE